MSFAEQRDAALAKFDELLNQLAQAQQIRAQMEELALDLRAGGVPREVLAKRMVAVLGMKLDTARKSLQTLEGRVPSKFSSDHSCER